MTSQQAQLAKRELHRSLEGHQPRVLHFLGEEVRGGIEEHVLSILLALREHGFEPHLAAPSALLAQMSAELTAGEVQSVAVENSGLINRTRLSHLRNYLLAQDFAIVHSHTFRSSLFASPTARMAGVPVVVETFHLPEVWRKRKWFKGNFWIDRQVGRFVDQYVAVSRSAGNHLIEHKGLAADKIRLIYNGRDLTRFHPHSERERIEARRAFGVEDRQVVATLGRLEVQKGHAFLIDALARLDSRWPSLVVLVAGSGELEADLMLQRDRAGLNERIKFLGIVRKPEQVLAAADVVVLPSLFEGLPLAAVEALACARPMVATDIEGTREVVIHERTGLLVPPGDPQALAVAIARLLSDPTFGAQLGNRGRAFVESQFDVRMQIEKTVAAYRELLGREKPSHRLRWEMRGN